jgi:hypothetical protein
MFDSPDHKRTDEHRPSIINNAGISYDDDSLKKIMVNL